MDGSLPWIWDWETLRKVLDTKPDGLLVSGEWIAKGTVDFCKNCLAPCFAPCGVFAEFCTWCLRVLVAARLRDRQILLAHRFRNGRQTLLIGLLGPVRQFAAREKVLFRDNLAVHRR